MKSPTVSDKQAPLLGQADLRTLRAAASRVLALGMIAPRLGRHLSRAELQLLALSGVVCEIIRGSMGEDATGEPVGDLVLHPQPYAPAVHSPKLSDNGQ